MIYFRTPGSRIEHLVDPIRDTYLQTLCGRDAQAGARYTDSDRGPDAKLRPLCGQCRAVLDGRRSTIKHIA